MNNITHKISSLRTAVATAIVKVSDQETIQIVLQKKVPKGDVLEFSRAAGLLGIKKTSDIIPDCHPLPIEYANITYKIVQLEIHITVEVHTIYRTGVEVEAMHGASVVALTIYDMLKPIDKGVEIGGIKLRSKRGGKSDFKGHLNDHLKCAVIVCSDSISKGDKDDVAGKVIISKLHDFNLAVDLYEIIPDESLVIQQLAKKLVNAGFQLILFTGGTGLSARDVTPQALQPLFTKMIPGVMEAARSYGQERTPYAMLSRGIAGFINHSLVLTLPGSTRGAQETMDALFPQILHVFKVAKGMRHDEQV